MRELRRGSCSVLTCFGNQKLDRNHGVMAHHADIDSVKHVQTMDQHIARRAFETCTSFHVSNIMHGQATNYDTVELAEHYSAQLEQTHARSSKTLTEGVCLFHVSIIVHVQVRL